MSPELLSGFAAVTGFLGALGGLVASLAAFRAGAAQTAAADKAEQNRIALARRDAIIAGHRVVAESLLVQRLVEDLNVAYQTLFTFSGGTGSSRLKLYTDRTTAAGERVGPVQNEARRAVEEIQGAAEHSEAELLESLIDLESKLVQVRREKEGLAAELAGIEAQNRIYREQAINAR